MSRLTRHGYVGWRVTDMLGGRLQILDGVCHRYWMPKLRVVELGICDAWRVFGRGVEPVIDFGWVWFVGRVRRFF